MRYNSFAWSDRRGLTLVEVVAGIALLATLLVSTLAAFRAHATQVRAAKNRLAAIAIADQLLSEWMTAGALPAIGQTETVHQRAGWSWRIIRPEPMIELHRLGAMAVRLEIIDRTEMEPRILTSVEVLVTAGGGLAQ